jgi:predicted amidohydrolase
LGYVFIMELTLFALNEHFYRLLESLLRARAIETQTYVIAAAQAGQHNESRASYGHAMVRGV